MALQTKDAAFMAGVAKLSQEEMDEVIRWTVKKDGTGVIDIRHLDREVNALVAPFAEYGYLFEVAKKEVFRVNTFRMSMGDTETDEFEVCLPGEYEDGESRILPILQSLTTGPISEDFHKIRHLEVDFAIRLEGANFSSFWDPIGSFGDEMSLINHNLHRLLPQLQTLEVRVHNSGFEKKDNFYHTLSGRVLEASDPAAEQWKKAEQMLLMQRALLFFGTMYDPPTLRKKSIEFVQRATPAPPVECEGGVFHRANGTRDKSDRLESHCWEACREAVTLCEMMGYPKHDMHAKLSWYILAPRDVITRTLDLESERRAVEAIGDMLKCDRAIVHFPCNPRVVRKDEPSKD